MSDPIESWHKRHMRGETLSSIADTAALSLATVKKRLAKWRDKKGLAGPGAKRPSVLQPKEREAAVRDQPSQYQPPVRSLEWATPGQCRHIEGDPRIKPLYCGMPALQGEAWCAGHRAVVYVARRQG